MLEVTVEMALVGKSHFGRHQAGRNAPFQEGAGPIDADADLVGMGGNPYFVGEGMHQGESAQACQVRQILQVHRVLPAGLPDFVRAA